MPQTVPTMAAIRDVMQQYKNSIHKKCRQLVNLREWRCERIWKLRIKIVLFYEALNKNIGWSKMQSLLVFRCSCRFVL